MAIQQRRGANADFDANKMLPGELAVTTDGTRKVYAAFAPGDVKELASKEDVQEVVDEFHENVEKVMDEIELKKEDALDELDKNRATSIVNTATGKTILTTDSANAPLVNLKAKGDTWQRQYEGKNFITFSGLTEQTVNGVTFTPVYADNGSLEYVLVNGTATSKAQYKLAFGAVFDLPTNIYICSGTPTGGSMATYYMSYAMVDYDTGDTIKDAYDIGTGMPVEKEFDKIKLYCDINICAGVTANNLKFRPQIEKGNVKTDFEIFVGGQPSPSMEYEQPIESLENVKVKVIGKNLWDKAYASDKNNWKIVDNPYYYCFPVYVGKDRTVTFSYLQKLTTNMAYLYVCVSTDNYYNASDKKWLYHETSEGYINNTITITSVDGYIYLWVIENGLNYGTFMQYIGNDLQIEYGSEKTECEPYTEQTLTLTSPVPITKWDKLVKRDGVWGWSIYHWKTIVDGSDLFVRYLNTYHEGFYITDHPLPNMMNRREGYCNQLRVVTDATITKDGLWLGSGNKTMYFVTNSFFDATLEDYGIANFKAHLNENPLEIWTYADTEQDFIPLAEEEQEKIKSVMMNYPTTTIISNAELEVEYVADTKNYIDNKFKELEANVTSAIAQLL